MFQSWPPEYQRLCAEYLIETGGVEDRAAVAAPMPDEPFPFGQPVSRQAIQCNADSFPFDQPKAAKVAAVAKRPARDGMRYSRNEVSEVDAHLYEGRSCYETAKIMDRKYPNQRTKHAWKQLADRIRGLGFKVMMDRAVDVEFK